MTQNASFIRKIIYCCAIVVLLFPLFLLGQPATSPSGEDGGTARIQRRYAGSYARQLRAVPGGIGQNRSRSARP